MSEFAKKRQKKAIQMIVGSWALGLISLWKLITVESDPYLWVATGMLAFGVAQWDQIMSAWKSRSE